MPPLASYGGCVSTSITSTLAGQQQFGALRWPLPFLLQDLTEQAAPHARILAVDTACVMPAHLVKCSTEKAYIYRSAAARPHCCCTN